MLWVLVPPTEASQVTWTPGAHYDEGHMLVNNDTLWVAQSAFVARDFDVERARGQWRPPQARLRHLQRRPHVD